MKINEILKKQTEIFINNKIESPRLCCELLLSFVLKRNRTFLLLNPDFCLSPKEEAEFFSLAEKRSKNMPIAYIIGEKEFYGLSFFVNENVLIPRPDTELVVETVLDILKKSEGEKTVLDIGTGSGAIAVSVSKNAENAKVFATDISKKALEVARKNAEKNEAAVEFFAGDILSDTFPLNAYDIVVSNPPYIEKAAMDGLMPDVACYEPHLALCGGEDGLDFYRAIIKKCPRILKKGGKIVFEIGYNQGETINKLLSLGGFSDILVLKDLADNNRAAVATYTGN